MKEKIFVKIKIRAMDKGDYCKEFQVTILWLGDNGNTEIKRHYDIINLDAVIDHIKVFENYLIRIREWIIFYMPLEVFDDVLAEKKERPETWIRNK